MAKLWIEGGAIEFQLEGATGGNKAVFVVETKLPVSPIFHKQDRFEVSGVKLIPARPSIFLSSGMLQGLDVTNHCSGEPEQLVLILSKIPPPPAPPKPKLKNKGKGKK